MCSVLHFTRSQSPISSNYYLNGSQILDVQCYRHRGIFMSTDLTWCDHYDFITDKAYIIIILLPLKHTTPSVLSNVLLRIRVTPLPLQKPYTQILYCSQVWHTYFVKDIIENIQRRATKCILNDYYYGYKSHSISCH